jgi:hypothetical protein
VAQEAAEVETKAAVLEHKVLQVAEQVLEILELQVLDRQVAAAVVPVLLDQDKLVVKENLTQSQMVHLLFIMQVAVAAVVPAAYQVVKLAKVVVAEVLDLTTTQLLQVVTVVLTVVAVAVVVFVEHPCKV